MSCIILQHHSWEPEVEVIHSLIVYSITYIEVGIEAITLQEILRRDDVPKTSRCSPGDVVMGRPIDVET